MSSSNETTQTMLPTFFNYNQEKTDNGYETIQDFFLSWLLRCSAEEYKLSTPTIINEYARRAVFFLTHLQNDISKDTYAIQGEINDDFKVVSVKTWRQWKHIDLLAEIIVTENGHEKAYLLNIENKWYMGITDSQLKKSKQAVESHYQEENKFEIINLAILCDHEKMNAQNKKVCIDNDYTLLAIPDITKCMAMDERLTGNELFDEYWYNFQ